MQNKGDYLLNQEKYHPNVTALHASKSNEYIEQCPEAMSSRIISPSSQLWKKIQYPLTLPVLKEAKEFLNEGIDL